MSDENQEAYQCGERALVNNHDTIRWKEVTNDRKFQNHQICPKGIKELPFIYQVFLTPTLAGLDIAHAGGQSL